MAKTKVDNKDKTSTSLNSKSILVVTNNPPCIMEKHNIFKMKMMVDFNIIHNDLKYYIKTTMNGFYCKDCMVYVTSEDIYKACKKSGEPNCILKTNSYFEDLKNSVEKQNNIELEKSNELDKLEPIDIEKMKKKLKARGLSHKQRSIIISNALNRHFRRTLTAIKREENTISKSSTYTLTKRDKLKVIKNIEDFEYPLEQANFKIKFNNKEYISMAIIDGYYCNKIESYIVLIDEYSKKKQVGEPLFKLDLDPEIEIQYNRHINSTPKPAKFLIRVSTMPCTSKGHKIEPIEANIDVLTKDGNEKEVLIKAYYCTNCGKYYILDSEFDRIRKIGQPLCQIYEEIRYIQDGYYSNLNPESTMHSYGYNVNQAEDLTAKQRQNILKFLIDQEIMLRSDITDFLSYLIKQRKHIPRMKKAIERWKEDIDFVHSYLKSNQIKKKVESIRIVRYIKKKE